MFTALNENRIALTDGVAVSPLAFATPGKLGARMYLEPGRPVTVDQLLRGMLTVSASDAAVALAEHSGNNVEAFVARMNAEARRLGMANTHFANPTGQSDPQNYLSAEDMAILARRLLADFRSMRRCSLSASLPTTTSRRRTEIAVVDRFACRRHENGAAFWRRLVSGRDDGARRVTASAVFSGD